MSTGNFIERSEQVHDHRTILNRNRFGGVLAKARFHQRRQSRPCSGWASPAAQGGGATARGKSDSESDESCRVHNWTSPIGSAIPQARHNLRTSARDSVCLGSMDCYWASGILRAAWAGSSNGERSGSAGSE